MARKGQVSIQDTLENNEDFEAYIISHRDILICMEVYSEFCGYCLATGNAVRKGKLEIGQDRIAMAKAMADHIDALQRFREQSEPVFLFISKGKLTRAVFGANGIELCRVIEEELGLMKQEEETGIERPKLEITELLPEESEKLEEVKKMEEEYNEAARRLKDLTISARKKRVNERLQTHLRTYNYILFFPHCHQAHYDLYEKWDEVGISVAAKDTFQIKPEDLKEILYMSDIDANEACVHALTKDQVLVVLFKMMETDTRDFVKLLRYCLYEEIPKPKDDAPPEQQVPPIPAFERYASISKTAREVRRDRYNAKLEQKRLELEESERLAREQERLRRQEEEDRERERKEQEERDRMARLAAGLPPEPEPAELEEMGQGEHVQGEGEGEREAEEVTELTVTDVTEAPPEEEKVEEMIMEEGNMEEVKVEEEEEEFHSDVEVEGEEYIPPGGLFVPGLYAPPNELAKNNGIVFFFPNTVKKLTPTIESEHLPPHILVMFTVDKRNDVMEMVKQLGNEVLAKGFFLGDDPTTAEHIAYSLKQYEAQNRPRKHLDRLALMVSRKRSLPLLQLTGYNPCYISSDLASGERDCLQLFPVGYGDEFVEEESVKEVEISQILPPPQEEVVEEKPPEEEKTKVEEEEEEEV